ncbi:MAG: nucleotide exchange factor GrpE [Actinobacteria bacterium]|nr:MAG: nucleotide exchange factor GrpE [Actinomycetota bacterium]
MRKSEQTIEQRLAGESVARKPDAPGAPAPGAGDAEGARGDERAPVDSEHARGDAGAAVDGAKKEKDQAVSGGDASEVLQGDLDELVAVAAQRDEYLSLAQRTQADFENFRKRVAREAAQAQERGVTKLAGELLPALDNLDRALAAAAENDPLLDGVRLVRSELSAALARAGVESFSPLGERFDPALHEAMATAEQPAEGAESGTIVEVYQPGYRLGQTIIRPARVVVAA